MRNYRDLKGDIALIKDKLKRIQDMETANERRMKQILLSLSNIIEDMIEHVK